MAKISALLLAVLGVIILTGVVSALITEVKVNSLDINSQDAFIAVGSTNTFEVSFTADNNDQDVQVEAGLNGQNINSNTITPAFDVIAGESYAKTLQITLPYQSSLNYGDEAVVLINIDGDNYHESQQFNVNVITPNSPGGGGGGNVNPGFIDDFCLYDGGSSENPGDLRVVIRDIEVTGFGDDGQWIPLDEIEIEVRVENEGVEDIDNIFLEWGLYDETNEEWVIDVSQEGGFDLRDGDDEFITIAFTLDNNLDVDLTDLDDGANYTLYARAFGEVDNVNNDKTCDFDHEVIDIIIPHDFVILKNIVFEPETVTAGQNVRITADVWNIGDRNQDDVSIRVYNDELGINKKIDVGDVDSFGNEELDTNILIPSNAEEKIYLIGFEVLDEDNDMFSEDFPAGDNLQSLYTKSINVEQSDPKVKIINPVNNSIVEGSSTSLIVETDKNAICKYGLGFIGSNYGGAMQPAEMEITGGTAHSQLIENLNPTKDDEKYLLSVTCTDEFGNFGNEKTYFTVIGKTISDIIPPIITLLDPDDGDEFDTSKNDKDIDFRFTVNDESEITSCTLFIDGDAEQTFTNTQRNVVISHEENLDSDDGYRWKVECIDEFNNVGVSETRDFDIDQKKNNDNNDRTATNFPSPQNLVFNEPQDSGGDVTFDFANEPIKINKGDQKIVPSKESLKIWTILLPVFAFAVLVVLVLMFILVRRR